MVSVCLPSDTLLQHQPSYLGFSYLGRGVSLHCCSSKVQPLLLTLDEGYLLMATPPDLEHEVAPLGTPVPMQLLLLEHRVASLGHHSFDMGLLLWAAAPDLGRGAAPLSQGSAWSVVAGVFLKLKTYVCTKTCTWKDVYSSFIYKYQGLEAVKMSFSW